MNNASTARPAALVVASLAAALQLNAPAMAQDASVPGSPVQGDRRSDTATLDKVMVIGSNIRDAIGGGASPVIVIDREAIDRTGVASLQQLFEKLPQNFGGGANGANVGNLGVDRDTGNNFGQGTAINLRGLGTGTTLTLINGHRVTPSNRYQYVDISLIPLSAIERVEILTDGASAIYGTDAVGGVVNIVLRRDFTGYETSLRYGSVTRGSMDEYQASQSAGWSWEGGHLMASYEFLKQSNLAAVDKDFSRNVTVRPYDIYPGSKRHSLYLDGVQALSDVLTLKSSALRSWLSSRPSSSPNACRASRRSSDASRAASATARSSTASRARSTGAIAPVATCLSAAAICSAELWRLASAICASSWAPFRAK